MVGLEGERGEGGGEESSRVAIGPEDSLPAVGEVWIDPQL